MTVGEFKTHFSDVIEQVKAGEEIAVTYSKKKGKLWAISCRKSKQKQSVN
jgi:antitoxin (DNA-binding transcriptional repressor) of toxin-antitoxin stability system